MCEAGRGDCAEARSATVVNGPVVKLHRGAADKWAEVRQNAETVFMQSSDYLFSPDERHTRLLDLLRTDARMPVCADSPPLLDEAVDRIRGTRGSPTLFPRSS